MTLTKGHARNAAMAPLDQRLQDMAQHVCNADGSPRAGVLGGANMSIVSTTATMNLAVAAAEFLTSKGKADGVMIFTNDGTVNVPVVAAPASNSRIDVLWVKHNDDTTGDPVGWATAGFGITAGIAAASPVKPAIPTGALELATLRIFAGATATNTAGNILTNTYAMTAARGGVVPFRTITERNAWTNRVDGQLAYCADVDAVFVYLADAIGGAAWVHAHGKPAISTPTLSGIYSAGTPAPRLVEQGGRLALTGNVISTSASFNAGTSYAIGSIPAAQAPSTAVQYAVMSNGVFAFVGIGTTGTLSIVLSATFTGALNLSLDGASWLDKRLG